MKVFFSVVFFCLFSVVTIAEEGAYFVPSSIGSSARNIRMAGIKGMSDYADSVFENPASLYRIKSFSSSFFTATLIEDAVYQNMAVAFRGPIGVIGVGLFNLSVDDIYKTTIDADDDFTFIIDETFSYDNYLAKLAYQFSFTRALHVGVSGTWFYSTFDTVEAFGANVDVGLIYRYSPLEVSILVQNIMSSSEVKFTDSGVYEDDDLSSEGQTEILSLDVIYSAKYMMRHITLYGQLKQCGANRDLSQSYALQLNPRFFPFIKASLGLKRFPVMNWNEGELVLSKISAISTGVELNLAGVDFNYAFQQSYLSESSVFYQQNHYFSLGFSF